MGGPLLIQYAEKGVHCTFIHVTTGRLEDPNATETEKIAYLQQLRAENEVVAKAMDCDFYSFGYSSNTLPSQAEFIQLLKKYFLKEKVDLVVTHARGTLHPRHYYTYETVTQAVRQLRLEGVDIDLLYGENCEDLAGFCPNKYLEVSDQQVNKWFDALSHYAIFNGKVNSMPYHSYYTTMGKIRAVEVDSQYFVKAFMWAPMIDNKL
ncbi:hypothetical protein RV14_GL002371 [Enterococcus ratti]|uniref:LmbE family protein n=2 Tax=Enterococcus ratti TaxID=150033 RepID=A0A1L8WLD4_9ENTE|nr:hypothetical protein RV14_GL002371 [Enterococcus ratti]